MGSPLDQFEAPELKTAVKRLYAAERAPAGLRRSIESILRSQAASEQRMRIGRAVMWQWAAAAVIAVGLAGLVWRVSEERQYPVGEKTLIAMVRTHDYC